MQGGQGGQWDTTTTTAEQEMSSGLDCATGKY